MDINDEDVHNIDKCPLCSIVINQVRENANRMFVYSCTRCGSVEISWEVVKFIDPDFQAHRYILSGYCRERTYMGLMPIPIVSRSLQEIRSSLSYPKTIDEKLDKIISYFGKFSKYPGHGVKIDPKNDYPISYSVNEHEFRELWRYLKASEQVDGGHGSGLLIHKGWKRYEQLQRNPPKANQGFVAMWFGQPDKVKEMNSVFQNGIKKAFDDAETTPKYNALRIDLLEHNDPIDQRILVEIRKSRFVVADLTGNRGGVYFEAGYALSLGIQVIWMCKEGTQVHFDVGQFPRIIWKDENDLHEKLKKKIEGMIF